jgi:urea carboxylase-associated protein 2
MPFDFSDLTPLARAAVPATSTRFAPELLLWEEPVPGGGQWSAVVRRGTTLRLTDTDTLKAQKTAFLTRGNVCFSDMGRVLCSIPEDSCGWHDTVCGVLDARGLEARYGKTRYQEQRNAMHRNGTDGLLVELAKWGLGKRDMHANLNLFSKVATDAEGGLHFDRGQRAPGQYVDLRFEMDVLVALSTAPHPLDPAPTWAPGPVHLAAWRSGTAGADDACRLSCAENGRGFINTERSFL